MKASGSKTEYTIVRSGRKTVGMSLDSGGNVIVRAPYLCPKGVIDRFVREHEGWIKKQRAKLAAVSEKAEAAGSLTSENIKLLAKSMKAALPGKLRYFASRLGVTYGRVTVRCQKSKWGSCSIKGDLNFNCLLMLAPEAVLDYVIVHELCHRRHMDHSKQFWAEVESICPDHKAYRKWLRTEGAALMRRAHFQ